MNPFEMVIGIVLIVSVASVLRARFAYNHRRHGKGLPFGELHDPKETEQLRGEIRQLKDRIAVLERIVTDGDRDRGLALEREIEALRDEREAR